MLECHIRPIHLLFNRHCFIGLCKPTRNPYGYPAKKRFRKMLSGLAAMIYLSYICTRKQHQGSLAQLVQSVCLTSRGSGVRIPQLPRRNGPLTGMRVARFCKERRYGGIAQLVQSACLTGRRSAVQIRMLLQGWKRAVCSDADRSFRLLRGGAGGGVGSAAARGGRCPERPDYPIVGVLSGAHSSRSSS